jgi:putative transposase
MPQRDKQLGLSFIRPGKRTGGPARAASSRPRVWHRRRPEHAKRHPVHVTLRALHVLPSLRSQRIMRLLQRIVEEPRFEGFQVMHFTIQRDHLHLVVEAGDKRNLSSGVRSLVIRLALRLNRLLGRRRGKLWADRYHRADLTSPRRVRNVLAYVYANFKKHGGYPADLSALDVFSTAASFDGWAERLPRFEPPAPPLPAPSTWLLSVGWRRHGLLQLARAAA